MFGKAVRYGYRLTHPTKNRSIAYSKLGEINYNCDT
jgi:hypothetical protein